MVFAQNIQLADAIEIMCIGFIMADIDGITSADKGEW
jgi:hypothetical protein